MKELLNPAPSRFKKDNLNLNIHSLFIMNRQNPFNFEASYQRGYVWTHYQKEELIQSIVEWLPINAIYWNEYTEQDPYEIIDGKQRLSTIFDYMNDKFTWRGYVYSELPEVYQSLIKGFSVAVYQTSFEKETDCERLYNRLNFLGTQHKPTMIKNL